MVVVVVDSVVVVTSSSLSLLLVGQYIVTLIHQSLKVNSKQIQKNLKLKSDVSITDYRSLIKYRLSKPIITVSGTLKT